MTSRGSKYWTSGAIPLIAPEVLSDIVAKASDLSIVVSDAGVVLSILVHPDHASFGTLDHWVGRDIREVLTVESIPKLDKQLHNVMSEVETAKSVELSHTDKGLLAFPIRYSFHAIGSDGAVLMLGRDLRPVAEMQQQLVKAQMALEQDYETQREYDTRLRVLMEVCSEAMIFVSQASGRITDVNSAAASLLDTSVEDLQGKAFAQQFAAKRQPELLAQLSDPSARDPQVPLEVAAAKTGKKLKILATQFRAAGERMILCRLAAASDAGAGGSDELATNLQGLFFDGADAIVFTDKSGILLSVNESFLGLVDAPHASRVKGRSLSDYFVRGAVDLKVLIENAQRVGRMRLYATKLATEYGSQIPVEISATWLNDRPAPVMVYVIRDASRVEATRRSSETAQDDNAHSVMELVGSSSLKDIVAETTDVVEKMCIETAVELTNNNRVAAAEMLGLSRQSLYVKLRKYGLLNREPD